MDTGWIWIQILSIAYKVLNKFYCYPIGPTGTRVHRETLAKQGAPQPIRTPGPAGLKFIIHGVHGKTLAEHCAPEPVGALQG